MKSKGELDTQESTKRLPIHFATSNESKFGEASSILGEYGISLRMSSFKVEEIQHRDLKVIARNALIRILSMVTVPVIVDDSGLFVGSLNGFPGVFSSYVFKTLGNEGILRLLRREKNRRATFRCAIAFGSPRHRPRVFVGRTAGEISHHAKGSHGFGFDPIFIADGEKRTFGEMLSQEKNRMSHRARALREFAEWYRVNWKSE